jgi:uncharacterized membrane protein
MIRDSLLELHRFFHRQALYPLALASVLCITLFLIRVFFSGRFLEYRNLTWNLALAWIPYTLSFSIAAVYTVFRRGWWLVVPGPSIIWLLFLPNAPYIVTDFWHLTYRPPIPFWFDIGFVACFAFTGCLLAVVSLHTMQGLIKTKLGPLAGWVFVLFSLVVSGLGIYLGRFGRFNSWDILLNPKAILRSLALPILDPLDNLRFIGFTLLFSTILLVFYLTFTALSEHQVYDGSK